MDQTDRDFWLQTARRRAWRVNLAWCLDRLATPLLLLGLPATVWILLQRSSEQALPSWLSLVSVLMVASAVVAWWRAKNQFIGHEQALVSIEARQGLHNALSTALVGLRSWPARPARRLQDGQRWNWSRLLLPPIVVCALFLAAFFWPLPPAEEPLPGGQPAALTALEKSLEQLRNEEGVQEDYLDELEKKIEELRVQNEQDWFSHASLEATDSLKQAHQNELNRLAQQLSQQEGNLRQAQERGEEMGQKMRARLQENFEQAMRNIEQGAMKPNQELLERLRQLEPGALNQLDAEELDQLRQNMRQLQQQLAEAGGDGAALAQEQGGWLEDEMTQNQGEGNGEGQGDGENQAGQGGLGQGPGHDPDLLGKNGRALPPQQLEKIEANDLSRSLPGDLLETELGEHEVDRQTRAPQSGGMIQDAGQGGDRIWHEQFSPAEQRAVKEFFK